MIDCHSAAHLFHQIRQAPASRMQTVSDLPAQSIGQPPQTFLAKPESLLLSKPVRELSAPDFQLFELMDRMEPALRNAVQREDRAST